MDYGHRYIPVIFCSLKVCSLEGQTNVETSATQHGISYDIRRVQLNRSSLMASDTKSTKIHKKNI